MVEPLQRRRPDPKLEMATLNASALSGSNMNFALAPALARFSLRGAGADVLAGQAFGCPLPTKPCRAETQDSRSALWLGPDEWLLLAPEEQQSDIVRALTEGLKSFPHSLVDISQRQTGLIISGDGAEWWLNSAIPLDLDISAFPVNMAVRTLFEKAEITLWRQDRQSFHIEVWRSFLPYVAGLLEAARS